MTDAIAKAQEATDRWNATVARLRGEVARREASGRQSKALDRALASLARAEGRAKAAADRLQALKRKQGTREAALAAAAALARRFDHLSTMAPAVMKQWRKDRKEEKKRIAKLKKAIERRTSVDVRAAAGAAVKAHFGIDRKDDVDEAAPAVEAETWPKGPIVPYVPPTKTVDRPGLLPGEFRLVDRVDDFDNYRKPKDWTAKHVGARMTEAFSVLRRLPMVTHPNGFGSAMPAYVHTDVELLYAAGGRRRGPIRGTSADEIARMNEALAWPLAYLAKKPKLARALNEWAIVNSWDGREAMDGAAHEAALIVAVGLNKGKVKVT